MGHCSYPASLVCLCPVEPRHLLSSAAQRCYSACVSVLSIPFQPHFKPGRLLLTPKPKRTILTDAFELHGEVQGSVGRDHAPCSPRSIPQPGGDDHVPLLADFHLQ